MLAVCATASDVGAADRRAADSTRRGRGSCSVAGARAGVAGPTLAVVALGATNASGGAAGLTLAVVALGAMNPSGGAAGPTLSAVALGATNASGGAAGPTLAAVALGAMNASGTLCRWISFRSGPACSVEAVAVTAARARVRSAGSATECRTSRERSDTMRAACRSHACSVTRTDDNSAALCRAC